MCSPMIEGPIELGIQRYLIAGLSASLLFLGGAGSLAAVSKIAGAVIGTGKPWSIRT